MIAWTPECYDFPFSPFRMAFPVLPFFTFSGLRHRLRGWLALFVLSAGLALTVGFPVQAQNKNSVADIDKTLDQARQQIDSLHKRLEAARDRPIEDADLAQMRNAALDTQEKAQAAVAALEPQLASVQARMTELGAPAEGVPEAPDVARQRAELTKNVGTLDAQLKLARLIAVEGGQAAERLLKLRRAQFQAELGVRTDSILAGALWNELRTQTPRDLRRARPYYEEIVKALHAAGPELQIAVSVAVALLLWLRVLAGRLLLKLTTARVAPGRLRRSLYALLQVLLSAATPGLIAQMIRATLALGAPLSEEMDTLLGQFVAAAWFGGFVAGLGSALLSPARPTWRLPPLSDEIASSLRWAPHALGLALFLSWLAQKLTTLVNASLAATVAQNAMVSLVLSAILGIALLQTARARHAAAKDQDKAPVAPLGYFAARNILWFALATSLACLLAGYVAMGSFIVRQAAWVIILLASVYLLDGLINDSCQAILASIKRRAGDEAYAKPMTRLRSQAAVLLSGLARIAVFVMALILLAAPFGDGPDAWLRRLYFLLKGLTLGQIHLRTISQLLSLAVLAGGFGIVRLVQSWLTAQYLPTTSLDPGMRLSAATLFGYAGYVLVAALSLSAVGIGLERVAWIASALSVGIGFGLQAVVQNFVSGLILLAERPVKVGDWVSLGGVEGDIRRINVRATEIQMADRSTVIVPNSEFITKVVRNVTMASPLGRIQIKLILPFNTDPELVRAVTMTAFQDHEEVLDEPQPDVMLDSVDATGLVFSATAYVSSPRVAYRVRSALLYTILKEFRGAGVPLFSPPAAPPGVSVAVADSDKQNPGKPAPGTSSA
jgi:small-conductance mechanosensitive channel